MSIAEEMVIPSLPVYQLSVDQYHSMITSGVLTSDDRIELLRGWMIPKKSNNPPYSVATELTADALRTNLPPGYCLRSEKPISLSDSEPEPDVVIAIGDSRRYATRHPAPEEIALIVEVSDTTLSRDRQIKLELYAEAQISCYWIVDLINKSVEVYSNPQGKSYLNRQVFDAAVPFRIANHPEIQIALASLLP